MSTHRPFLVLPRFTGASLVVIEPEALQAPDGVLAGLATSLTVAVVASGATRPRDVERVLVLDGGRVVEHGTPAELCTAGGVYARLRRAWDSA
jgi:ABC-type multidrug transport system fused ATPase/permease subunit